MKQIGKALALAALFAVGAFGQTDSITVAVVETNVGTFEIQLFDEATPKTAENFAGLAKKGYFDGVIFHRVIKGFVIQGGDPTGKGSGGESLWGGPFEDEFVDTLRHDSAGVVSMANAGPNTNTSQFFITLGPAPWLDGKHSVFGKVISGMETIRAIENIPTTLSFERPANRPKKDVVMKKVTIERRARE
ncbi:MAG: peptidylprolyl isomerase [Ignavibacteriales bacterium]|nr:peptidylprolyl isomerase [Ignavibacteriales bacterium]